MPNTQPVLNVVSATDVFFSPSNSWLGNPSVLGRCATTLKDNLRAEVVLIPGARSPCSMRQARRFKACIPARRPIRRGWLAKRQCEMALIDIGQRTPNIDKSARITESAQVIGNVQLHAESSVWFGAVVLE